MEKYEFDDYTFAFTSEMNGKITTELEFEDEPEENSTTVYVKTISGKTTSNKCDKKQKADLVHQRKVLNDKKTIEENNIGAEAAIEMSLRLLGGMKK